ncbi:hypothetical protein [Methylosinus sp. LW4]|uniref:hypothetical protein n=1 Tax=Methylosinus sp. LW4 TaxID=136993 RepID=UPI0003773409|nr:hypothetical protein [Methylosinus sp. LW4]
MTRNRIFALVASASFAISGAVCAEDWTPKRLPDGQPDIQGFYRPEIAGTYSLVRPRRGVGVQEQDAYQKRKTDNDFSNSRIVDPPDRQVPYQPWARAKQLALEASAFSWTLPEHIEPQARCVPGGVTRTIFWTQDFEIRQYPNYIVFLHDQNHTSRIIPLDGRPHISERIKLWMADSRGHWEGTTLVVDVTNDNAKHRLSNEGDFSSDKVHIVEKYIFTGPGAFRLEQLYDDPSVYTRPWTLASNFSRAHAKDPNYELWFNECHEGERDVEHLYLGDKTKPY